MATKSPFVHNTFLQTSEKTPLFRMTFLAQSEVLMSYQQLPSTKDFLAGSTVCITLPADFSLQAKPRVVISDKSYYRN